MIGLLVCLPLVLLAALLVRRRRRPAGPLPPAGESSPLLPPASPESLRPWPVPVPLLGLCPTAQAVYLAVQAGETIQEDGTRSPALSPLPELVRRYWPVIGQGTAPRDDNLALWGRRLRQRGLLRAERRPVPGWGLVLVYQTVRPEDLPHPDQLDLPLEGAIDRRSIAIDRRSIAIDRRSIAIDRRSIGPDPVPGAPGRESDPEDRAPDPDPDPEKTDRPAGTGVVFPRPALPPRPPGRVSREYCDALRPLTLVPLVECRISEQQARVLGAIRERAPDGETLLGYLFPTWEGYDLARQGAPVVLCRAPPSAATPPPEPTEQDYAAVGVAPDAPADDVVRACLDQLLRRSGGPDG